MYSLYYYYTIHRAVLHIVASYAYDDDQQLIYIKLELRTRYDVLL